MKLIPFNRPFLTGNEFGNIEDACARGALSGNGHYSTLCEEWLVETTGTERALLTHSCTGALEMASILLDLQPGDEVIMPSYTFVSTANAVALRGAVPVFADIRADTLNIDETKIEALITPRTRSIWVVHYAGVSCEMDKILEIAKKYNLSVVEDAAQGILATYKGRPLGSMGDMGTYSFHETKNVTCGEGGALLVNRNHLISRSEIIHEKGTDRRQFSRGVVDKYTWQDLGSSFVLGELASAFLKAQLDASRSLTDRRLALWTRYHDSLAGLEETGFIKRPTIPPECEHNAHMYYVLLSPKLDRSGLLRRLREKMVHAVFHYVPLDSSPAGRRIAGTKTELPVTKDLSNRIMRLPLWTDMKPDQVDYIVSTLIELLRT